MAEPDQASAADGNAPSPMKSSPMKSSTEKSAPPPPPAAAAELPTADAAGTGGGDDEDMLLVTEFPPPPYYYTLASRQTPSHLRLTPPEIPHRAFRVAAKKVAAERQKAREESERIRLEAEKELAADGSSSAAAGDNSKSMDADKKDSTASDDHKMMGSPTKTKQLLEDDDSIDPDDPNEPVVGVFGEIVEDPTLVVEEECHDPVEIRENVRRLNRAVLNGFLDLVQKLVNDPHENKKLRDELSHNLFLMLQECNKFREHQAREILIDTLEQQLESRREGLDLLREQIGKGDDALATLAKFREESA